jgi:peptidoglycan hydrolase-like protein with peptidoglycan-binding domain
LRLRDYHVGKIDGIYGTLTTAAVAAFQVDNGVPALAVGRVDQATWDALDRAPKREFSKAREDTTAESLRRSGSVIVANADRTRQIGWVSSILGALGLGNSYFTNYGPTLAKPSGTSVNTAVSTDAAAAAETLARAVTTVPSNLVREFFALTPQQLNTVLLKAHDGTLVVAQKAAAAVGPVAASSGANLVEGILPLISSILPNAGGSVAALVLGVASQIFGSRIIQRRVEQQKQGMNIGPDST